MKVKAIKQPLARSETTRQELIGLLKESKHSLGSLSKVMRRQKKELVEHLDAIQKTVVLTIDPAECLKCGYVFQTRSKVTKPSKCPKCKGTYIEEPLYFIHS